MIIVADLHIHSRFSRATSKSLDFISLHRSALEKGIGLVGTGDFTHPGWMAEIESQLEPAEDGLFRLKPDLRRLAEDGLARACAGAEVRFVLQVEISNIYKKADRTRKNHNLVFAPSIEAARKITDKLDAIGNIASDGRPILGLDARDLLEITLESDPLSFLVPAHIWTPWFSMLGSKSGFDSIEECFGDLSNHIFAAETGLSSDPSMNWRLSELDRITLISDSDAHSAVKLGREANLLDIELGYAPLLNALKGGNGFLGTIEFYPEEGKYHLDGHRKCNVRLDPEETRELDGRCPVCGGKLTVGVMSRVLDLADRPAGFRPKNAAPFQSLVPLAEVAGEVIGAGPATKKVQALVRRVLTELGPELPVLKDVPLEDIQRIGGTPLAEAVRRVRTGELTIAGGYDGEFGTVQIFEPGERDHLLGQLTFVGSEVKQKKKPARKKITPSEPKNTRKNNLKNAPQKGNGISCTKTELSSTAPLLIDNPLSGLNPDQRRAAESKTGPLLVVAGPGTGKTRTLVARIAHQVQNGTVRPKQVLAIAFTNQAAEELRERISHAVPGATDRAPLVTTFHGLGLSLLKEFGNIDNFSVLGNDERLDIGKAVAGPDVKKREVETMVSQISLAKQSTDPIAAMNDDPELIASFKRYETILRERNALDVDDLVLRAYQMLANDDQVASTIAKQYLSISVDEYQDVNDVQAALIKLLAPGGHSLLAIGDPEQAIYGFRGARPDHFARFDEAFPGALVISLNTTYRLTDKVLAAARSVVGSTTGSTTDNLVSQKNGPPVEIAACPTPESEAEQIVVRLEQIIGGTSYFAIDSGRGGNDEELNVGFGDIAILCRTKAQRKEILAALGQSGIPCRTVGEDEPHDPRSEKVAVMTMHASKGREFDTIFISGVEPCLVPLEIEGITSDHEEERRLLYVAMTRAKRLAVLSHASKRMMFGKVLPGGSSRFLANLPKSAVEYKSPSLPARKPASKQLSLF